MVGKKSGRALLRDEGLERTDNGLGLTSWPQANAINQKNYYTEYLKRDDQILPLRLLQEERRNEMVNAAKERTRPVGQAGNETINGGQDATPNVGTDDNGDSSMPRDAAGAQVVVIHPGSQNLRIGLASDPLPKTIPMVIAKQAMRSESELGDAQPDPKRRKLGDGPNAASDSMFGEDFAQQYSQMCADLKVRMRANKRRVLPNSKELIVNYNKRTPPDTIPVHNDPLQIEWTELPQDIKAAPRYICGQKALRIPDDSTPRYKLHWPLKYGWYNEADYDNKRELLEDFALIIEDAIKSQLGLKRRDIEQYSCVFVIPDLYEKAYVTHGLEMLLNDIGFARVSLVQESLAATFGAGFIASCVVDIGAQKTSICCVEEGACNENSRINLKYGGRDVTDTFLRMMLHDSFPYQTINLNRRYDFLLAEEIKFKVCTMNESDVSPQLHDFHLRAPGQDTRKYTFKTYDEILLGPQGYFQPTIFDHSQKLRGRRKLIAPSMDVFEGAPNEPVSIAQSDVIATMAPAIPVINSTELETKVEDAASVGQGKKTLHLLMKVQDQDRASVSAVGSPAPEDISTPVPGDEEKDRGTNGGSAVPADRDDVLATMALDRAILTSIYHATRGDERRTREFLGQIMVIGGGATTPGLHGFLEQRLKELRPGWFKDILVGTPPREMDFQGVIWKGGSVFGKLKSSSDSWIGKLEYDRLGTRCLAYKCIWQW